MFPCLVPIVWNDCCSFYGLNLIQINRIIIMDFRTGNSIVFLFIFVQKNLYFIPTKLTKSVVDKIDTSNLCSQSDCQSTLGLNPQLLSPFSNSDCYQTKKPLKLNIVGRGACSILLDSHSGQCTGIMEFSGAASHAIEYQNYKVS